MNRLNRRAVTRSWLVSALLLTAVVATVPAFAASEQKIGIVDLQRTVSETREEQNVGVRFFSKKIDVTPLLIKKADEMYGKLSGEPRGAKP